jgi:hypothetical protein
MREKRHAEPAANSKLRRQRAGGIEASSAKGEAWLTAAGLTSLWILLKF